jgi:hypothetical protein
MNDLLVTMYVFATTAALRPFSLFDLSMIELTLQFFHWNVVLFGISRVQVSGLDGLA